MILISIYLINQMVQTILISYKEVIFIVELLIVLGIIDLVLETYRLIRDAVDYFKDKKGRK